MTTVFLGRIMKTTLPANGKIAKDAKETVQECVSDNFISSEMSDKCQREKRKTINGYDLLWAMATLRFEDYIDPLKVNFKEFFFFQDCSLSSWLKSELFEGDTKGTAKGGDGSGNINQPDRNPQITHQGSLTQGTSYMNS